METWFLRVSTFALAAFAAASVAYWSLKWIGAAPVTTGAPMAVPTQASVDTQAVARLLGGAQVKAAAQSAAVISAASQFKLTGVVAERRGGGYALIATEGKPARPYRVGSPVSDSLVLHSVTAQGANLAASTAGPVTVTLDLPKPEQP